MGGQLKQRKLKKEINYNKNTIFLINLYILCQKHKNVAFFQNLNFCRWIILIAEWVFLNTQHRKNFFCWFNHKFKTLSINSRANYRINIGTRAHKHTYVYVCKKRENVLTRARATRKIHYINIWKYIQIYIIRFLLLLKTLHTNLWEWR